MAVKTINTVKLGLFVLAGLAFLIMLLYMIGKNQNLFGNTFELKARFSNVQGLMPGNNVRFAGIDAGSVKSVEVLNDTTVEVRMLIKTRMQSFIRKNAVASISTDGLMGNKLVNIAAVKTPSDVVQEGDVLQSTTAMDTEYMLEVLGKTNADLAVIAGELKTTVQRFNRQNTFWTLLEDASLPQDVRGSLHNIKVSSEKLTASMGSLQQMLTDLQEGKGSLGQLLKDTAMIGDVRVSVQQLQSAAAGADSLMEQLNTFAANLNRQMNEGKGTVQALLKDEEMRATLHNDLRNIEAGTQRFNEVMDAVKNSFLFRGYFRRQAQKK